MSSWPTLRIYVSRGCAGCGSALALADTVRQSRPQCPVEVIDLRPAGEPYCLAEAALSRGLSAAIWPAWGRPKALGERLAATLCQLARHTPAEPVVARRDRRA